MISACSSDWLFQKEASQLHANGEQFAEMQDKIQELGKCVTVNDCCQDEGSLL